MASKLSLFLVCALVAAVASSPAERSRRSPDDSASEEQGGFLSGLSNAYDKTKETVAGAVDKIQHSDAYQATKDGLSNLGDKVKKVGEDIKNSDAYEKLSSEVQHAGDKLKEVGTNIRDSDTFQNVKTSISDTAGNLKDKVKDTLDD